MLDIRPTEESAWQSQVFQITVADILNPLFDVLADEGTEECDAKWFLVKLGALIGYGRDRSIGSDTRISKAME